MNSRLEPEKLRELAEICLAMRNMSYVPYSHFAVGAALLGKDGRIYTGCNIENAAFSPTNCAERTAFFKAVSEGCLEFEAICISGGPQGQPPEAFCPPCGMCRQVMSEFCGPDFEVNLVKSPDEIQVHTLSEVLPLQFDLLG